LPWSSSPSSSSSSSSEQDENNNSEEEENSSSSNVSATEIISTDSTVQVTVQREFQQNMLDALSDKSETWIEIIPVSSDETQRASLESLASQMSVSFPSQVRNNTDTYQLVVYNQDGVYKLGMVLSLSSQNARTLVEGWSSNIPFDMSNFALEASSRTVVEPDIKTRPSTVQGGSVQNYYYNYTDTFNSIDVAGESDRIFMSTSKQMQQELANQLNR